MRQSSRFLYSLSKSDFGVSRNLGYGKFENVLSTVSMGLGALLLAWLKKRKKKCQKRLAD